MGRRLLEVRHLRTSFFTEAGEIKAVDDVSYHVDDGEVVAIVGESGCGKTMTQLSVLQLIAQPPGRILGGQVLFRGEDLLRHAPKSREMRNVRGAGIAMIFQEPMSSLNPVLTIGSQLSEVIRVHTGIGRRAAWQRAVAALEAVGIPEPAQRMRLYPFQMSGGMRQRVMIATAIACHAELIIADEPTTALDVTTQAQVMELLMELVGSHGKSLVLITHNLGLVTRYADRVHVMYAGRIVEQGATEQIMTRPRHPYTIGLLNALPRLEGDPDTELVPIDGSPPSLRDLPDACAFRPRCRFAEPACAVLAFPPMRAVGPAGHLAACHVDIDAHAGPRGAGDV